MHQATGIAIHKILRIIYGVLKSRKPFNEKADWQNRKKSAQKQKEKKGKIKMAIQEAKREKHRLEVETLDTPISVRNYVGIKKQAVSQSSS